MTTSLASLRVPVATLWLCVGCYAGARDEDVGSDDGGMPSGSSVDAPTGGGTSGEAGGGAGGEVSDDGPTTGDAPLSCWELDGVCMQPPPSGWVGPFLLHDGPAADAPECPEVLPQVQLLAHAGLQLPGEAQCTPCTCNTPVGGTCGAVPLTAYQMTEPGACGGCSSDYLVQAGVCTDALACGDTTGSIVTQAASASGGVCTPSVAYADLPELAWESTAVGCATESFAAPNCDDGAHCVPPAPPGFEAGACIRHDGDVACPGAPYTDRRTFFLGAADGRGCDTCSCGESQGAECDGRIDVFDWDTPGCSVQEVHYNVPTDCTWKSVHHQVIVTLDPPHGGTCAPGGGAPIGTASPDAPVTVCCAAPQDPGPVG